MDVVDVLVKSESARNPDWLYLDQFNETELDRLMQTLVSNSLEIKTEQNSIDVARLMQTRIFDYLAMKLHRWLECERKTDEGLTLNLKFLLRLLEHGRYPTIRGFIVAHVWSTTGGSRNLSHEMQRFDVPDSEHAAHISDAVKREICAQLTRPNYTMVDSWIGRVTLPGILRDIQALPGTTELNHGMCLE